MIEEIDYLREMHKEVIHNSYYEVVFSIDLKDRWNDSKALAKELQQNNKKLQEELLAMRIDEVNLIQEM